MSPEYSAVLVRYGEIGIKSRQTRKYMSHLLVSQITSALTEQKIVYSRVKTEFGRLFIMTKEAKQAAEAVARVFGVVSASPVVVVDANFDLILETGLELAHQSFQPRLSFAVGARRLGNHPFTSQDIRRKLGALILDRLPDLHLTVNLTDPQQNIYVEVRDEVAYLFTETMQGVGGMPTGSQGTVVCLIDGSLSSLVASYRVMKRGAIPIFVTFNEPKTILSAIETLASYIHGLPLKKYMLSFPHHILASLNERSESLHVVYRRNLINVASEIAILEGADGIVTGDIIGYPAQTISALRLARDVRCDFPIFQPCAGDDIESIRDAAHRIGIHVGAEVPLLGCSTDNDFSESVYDDVVKIEAILDIPSAKEQLKTAQIVEII